jgi:tRNA pseudouridine55 synthase
MDAILLVNKDKDMTSRDVVNKLIKVFNTKRIGHTGTLDPIATGVLVVCIGKYTKLCDLLTSTYKEYIATIKLGIKTDTSDITGTIVEEKDYQVDKDKINEVLKTFLGKSTQQVPIYSAVKINGKKLYEYARNNEEVELPKKEVTIKEIELLEFDNEKFRFRCLVSKGTYIRSLINDICNDLNIIGTMSDLRRTKQGKFNIEDAYTIDEVRNNKYKLLTIEDVLDTEIVNLEDNELLKIESGNPIEKEYTKDYILFKYKGLEHALYKYEDNKYKMYIKIKI